MFSSLDSFENSPAFVVFFIVAFPLLFGAIWCFVLWITARMSGWQALGTLYRYDNQPVTEWMFRGGGGVYRTGLPFAGMRGRLAVGANCQGIVVKPPFILRPSHPPLFLPYDKMQNEEAKQMFTFEFVMITMQDVPNVKVGILKSARDMAEKVRT